jgi:hypothetical protein
MAHAVTNPDGVKAALARNAARHKRQATDLASRILAESNDPTTREIVEAWEKETGLSVRRAETSPAAGTAEQLTGLDRLRSMSQAEIAAELRSNPDAVYSAMAGRPVTSAESGAAPSVEDIRQMSAEKIMALPGGAEEALRIANLETSR